MTSRCTWAIVGNSRRVPFLRADRSRLALNYWRYSPSDGYDLTRGSSGPHARLQTTTGHITIDPKLTALVVVDMQ